jgi:hypothetical protein
VPQVAYRLGRKLSDFFASVQDFTSPFYVLGFDRKDKGPLEELIPDVVGNWNRVLARDIVN